MRIFFVLWFLSLTSVYGQFDNENTVRSGESLNTSSKSLNTRGFSRSSPSLTNPNNTLYKNTRKKWLQDETPQFSMEKQEQFIDQTQNFDPKYLAKQEGSKTPEKFKKNQNFGEFKSSGKFVKIVCRDHMAVDGDQVQIIVNGEIQVPRITLQSNFTEVHVSLKPGFNKIDILALNQGLSGPNTAEFRLYNDQGVVLSKNIWNLATGFEATMMVVKEDEQ